MSCQHCPHCQSGGAKGGLSILSDLPNAEEQNEEKKDPPKFPVRGKAREYSQFFEIAWKQYPRREQKFEAFAIWNVRAKEVGEAQLLTLILGTLIWQRKGWAKEGNKFVPYFERYLKRRKWEDEPMVSPQAVPRPIDDRLSQNTSKKIAEINSYADKRPSAEELAKLLRGAR